MKKSEAAELVMMLMGAFSNAKTNESTSQVYEMMLADLDVTQARQAVTRLIATSKFLPSIAEIREACTSQSVGPRKTGLEAYEELNRAVERHGGTPRVKVTDDGRVLYQKPWPPVSEEIARAVRAVWGSWGDCCRAMGPDAPDRARFVEAWDTLSTRQRTDLVSGMPLPAPAADAPRLAPAVPRPTATGQAKTPPRARPVPAIAPQNETPVPVVRVAPPRLPPAPTPFQGRRLSAEDIDAELNRRSP